MLASTLSRPIAASLAFLLIPGFALAAPLVPTPGPPLSHVGNLVANGSFEDHPDGGATEYYWATGTSWVPYATPSLWTAAGSTNAYAIWGNSNSIVLNAVPAADGNVVPEPASLGLIGIALLALRKRRSRRRTGMVRTTAEP